MLEVRWKYKNDTREYNRPFNEQRGANALFDILMEHPEIEWVELGFTAIRRFESKYRNEPIKPINGGYH